jgi:MSHA biogenesis protein MshM
MYLSHFGLNEPPFRITPHTDFFFEGANRGATLEALLYAILHDEGIVKVSGEVGSGKTMLCRVLMERLPANVETIYLSNPSLTRDEILYAIAEDLKLESNAGRPTLLLRALQEHLIKLFAAGRRVVVLIDEAHAMPQETLEEIRLLSNLESNRHKLLQLVLFGQPELDDQLNTPNMRQLKERITHGFRLEPLVRHDIESYIDFRMRAAGYRGPNVFAPGAMRLITQASQGLTRRINILSDKSLLAAFADNTHQVGAKHARAAIRDSEFYRPSGRLQRWRIAVAGIAAGIAIGAAATLLWRSDSVPATSTVPSAAQATVPRPAPVVEVKSAPVQATVPRPVPVVEVKSAPVQAAATNSAASVSPTATSAASGAKDHDPPPPVSGPLTLERFFATQEWLKTARGDQYSIQLLTAHAREMRFLEELLARVQSRQLDLSDFYVYGVKIDGQQYYRLAYGLFTTLKDVNQGINRLPQAYQALNPYVRSVERMRSQNRQ